MAHTPKAGAIFFSFLQLLCGYSFARSDNGIFGKQPLPVLPIDLAKVDPFVWAKRAVQIVQRHLSRAAFMVK